MVRSIETADRAGIAVAVACALHCLAAPFLATSFQVAGALASEPAELAFLGASLLISGTTVVANCFRGRARAAVWSTFLVGASLLLTARSDFAWVELEQPLVAGGAAMIVAAHVVNLFACRCRKDEPLCVGAD